MKKELADTALTILENGRDNATDTDLAHLRKFCDDFSNDFHRGAHNLIHAVKKWTRALIRAVGGAGAELARRALRAAEHFDDLMTAPRDVVNQIINLLCDFLGMSRTRHQHA